MMKTWYDRFLLYTRKNPVIAFVWDMIQVYLDRRVSRGAAELAYYLMLTLFPTLIMTVGIVGMLPLEADSITYAVERILPQQSAELVSDYIAYVLKYQNMGMFTSGLITTITAASAAFRGLVSISGEIYGRRVYRGIWSFLFSILFSVLLVVLIYVSLLVVLTGSWFVHFLQNNFPLLLIPFYWPVVRLLLMFSVAMLSLTLLYRITAPRGRTHPPVLAGACLTALLLTISSSLFSMLISVSSRYSLIYGSLASIIILMVWLYLCGNIVILGNVFNYVRWRHMRGLPVALILEQKI
jgi:membrane protein